MAGGGQSGKYREPYDPWKSDDEQDMRWGWGWIQRVVLWFVLLGVLIWLGGWIVYPWLVRQETLAAHNSYGFVNAQQKHLLELVRDYNAQNCVAGTDSTGCRQQRADVAEIKADVQMMEPSDVPQPVSELLRQSG